MTTIFNHFCSDQTAFINPSDFTKELPDFPEVCMTTFSENIINTFADTNKAKVIVNLYSANGTLPVYEFTYAGKRFGMFLSRVGAPACAAGMEEVIALGAKKIVQFGCCGVLNEAAVGSRIIVPVSAVRDEGTSYHYIDNSEEISADLASIHLVTQCLEKLKVPYVLGKVWTTDAIYRETLSMIKERKKEGCIAVEMECSASLAVARFRNVPIIQFLYGADCLDSEEWEPRDLMDYGFAYCSKYMEIALACACALSEIA